MILLREVPNVVGTREGWELYFVTGAACYNIQQYTDIYVCLCVDKTKDISALIRVAYGVPDWCL
jgi:hypothetical protein